MAQLTSNQQENIGICYELLRDLKDEALDLGGFSRIIAHINVFEARAVLVADVPDNSYPDFYRSIGFIDSKDPEDVLQEAQDFRNAFREYIEGFKAGEASRRADRIAELKAELEELEKEA